MSEIATFSVAPTPAGPSAGATSVDRALKNQNAAPASNLDSDDATASSYQGELTKLSSILNGLQKGAKQIRAQFVTAANQVRSGTYQVDPLAISRSIVSDLLGPVQ